jgi:hypothetical protein
LVVFGFGIGMLGIEGLFEKEAAKAFESSDRF